MPNPLESTGRALNATGDALDSKEYTPPSDGGGGGGGGGGGDGSPQTTPTQPPADRAAQAGLTIDTTVDILSTGDVLGESNTMYVVDGNNGPLEWDGPMDLGTVDNVAICGKNDVSVPIPAGFRDYLITATGGSGLLWSGIDVDQTAAGAWGRFNLKADTNSNLEFVKNVGQGRRANPDPSGPYGATSGPTVYMPALSGTGTNHIRNVSLVHGGYMANNHDYGDRPIGIFLDTIHKGTLRIARSRFEEFPNNALYATNTPGSVIATDTRFFNNGVTNGRIAFGRFENCTHGFDYQNTGLGNAQPPDHAANGISVEDKGHGTDVDVINCSVHMLNVAVGGSGIVTNDFGDGAGTFGTIEGTDVHIHNANDNPDVDIRKNGSVDRIADCAFAGTADAGVSVKNTGPAVTVSNNGFNYPSGRLRYEGAID